MLKNPVQTFTKPTLLKIFEKRVGVEEGERKTFAKVFLPPSSECNSPC